MSQGRNIAEHFRNMVAQGAKISEILKSLVPRDQEELSLLRFILHCAHFLQRGGLSDLSLGPVPVVAVRVDQSQIVGAEIKGFLEQIPEDSKRYLYGLVEAIEIYQSIYGRAIPIHNITMKDTLVYELKQIRDFCLQDGLHSIY